MGKIAEATVAGAKRNLTMHLPVAVESYLDLGPGDPLRFRTDVIKNREVLVMEKGQDP